MQRSKKNRIEVGGRKDDRRPLGIRVVDVRVGPMTSLGVPHRTASTMEGGSVGEREDDSPGDGPQVAAAKASDNGGAGD
jgi:hypothetical protein